MLCGYVHLPLCIFPSIYIHILCSYLLHKENVGVHPTIHITSLLQPSTITFYTQPDNRKEQDKTNVITHIPAYTPISSSVPFTKPIEYLNIAIRILKLYWNIHMEGIEERRWREKKGGMKDVEEEGEKGGSTHQYNRIGLHLAQYLGSFMDRQERDYPARLRWIYSSSS